MRLRTPWIAAPAILFGACVGTPSVSGVPGASPAPEKPWTPPPGQRKVVTATDTSARAAVPPDLSDRIQRLTLPDIVELGLRNNPETRLAWANAEAAAAAYGSARGEWLPTIDGDVSAQRIKTVASAGRVSVEQSVLAPSATLSYLLLDFGGRTGRVSGAKQRLLAAGIIGQESVVFIVKKLHISPQIRFLLIQAG